MTPPKFEDITNIYDKPLSKGFNKKKFSISYSTVNNKNLSDIQNLSRRQCLCKDCWPKIEEVNSWVITAETATFMKWGGLGMIASELPEYFNIKYKPMKDEMLVVTPLYLGDTGKKKATLEKEKYCGAEGNCTEIKEMFKVDVPFLNDRGTMSKYKVSVYKGKFENVDYIFLANDRFFSINPHKDNPSTQDGCYVYNANGVNEVERFAFFSKAVYETVKLLAEKPSKQIKLPNVLLANDWHSGALSGLMKYLTTAKLETSEMSEALADKLRNIPVVHIAHHLGYQGWDYENTSKILNSLYENAATMVLRNAKAIKNSNPRATNTIIVSDCYNQASCAFHLADRVVTVSKNYLEEVSKELDFGYDFRDILKMRKDHRNFFGIVNGYEKSLISPNRDKIAKIASYFGDFDLKFFDEKCLQKKVHNKTEVIKLLSKLATDKKYAAKVIPLIETYRFEDISDLANKAAKVPMFCATSRLVEQKGYDIAAQAIVNLLYKHVEAKKEYPIFILGGAGDNECYDILKNLKDKVSRINKEAARRVFVFRGYKDEFAYALQLASDFYMMPSKFEPCGLTQMEAMAKGTIPVATSTGGLVDTIDDCLDGFRTKVFFTQTGRRIYGNNATAKRLKTNANAYTETLQKALETFCRHPEKVKEMTIAAMRKDFSWNVDSGGLSKYHNLLKTGHL